MAATLAQIKTLRDRTGAGLGDCKAALKETGGDLGAAARLLKRRQQAQERAEAREKATRKRAAQADEGPDPTELIGPLKARLEATPDDLVARRDAFGDLLRDLEPLAPGPGLEALVDALLPALEDWPDEVRSTRADDPWTRRFLEGEADPRLRLFRRLSAAYLSSSWTGESLCLDDGPIRRDRAGAIDALMTVGDGLRQLHLSYQTLGREAARLLLRGPLASLEGLDLDDAGAWTWGADILDAPWASRLRRLRANDSGLDLERTLALCFACPELEHLALGKNPLLELPEPLGPGERPLLDGAPEALWSLAQADLPAEERLAQGISRLRALREVELESTGVGERTCAVLAELPHLRSADLSGNPIGAEGLAELGRSASLRRLDLSETRGDGILGLASLTLEELCWQGNRLPALEALRALRLGALDLRHTPLDDAALAGLCALDLDVLRVGGALVASPSAWPLQLSIRGLEIYEGALSSGAFAALAHTPGFEGLRVLTLWGVPLAEDGAAALARTRAEELVLYGTGLGAEALAAAVHREDWRPRNLFLHGLQLTEAVALALAESPVLREVETLHLSECTGVGDAFCEALVGAGQARALRLLRLEETQVGAKGATALLDWGKPRYIGLERCRTGAAGKAIKARNRFA